MIHLKKVCLKVKFPKKLSKSEAFSTILASTAIQDNSSFQKKPDDLQKYNKCSWDSSSALQKAHKGDPPF